jgi:hypothetical protein
VSVDKVELVIIESKPQLNSSLVTHHVHDSTGYRRGLYMFEVPLVCVADIARKCEFPHVDVANLFEVSATFPCHEVVYLLHEFVLLISRAFLHCHNDNVVVLVVWDQVV